MNQPLESHLENLQRQLRFLPEQEREKELAELRSHLEERIAAYESAGDSPEQALISAWQKFGDPKRYAKQLRLRYFLVTPMKSLATGAYQSTKLYLWLGLWAGLTWKLLAGFWGSMPLADLFYFLGGPVIINIRDRVKPRSSREEFFSITGAAVTLWGCGVLSGLMLLPQDRHASLFRWPIVSILLLVGAGYWHPFRIRVRIKKSH